MDCIAALNIKGEHFPCDWPADDDGRHDGWGHSSKAAGAVWVGTGEQMPSARRFPGLAPILAE